MTLRLRLVLALVALVAVAQGGFFAGTYLIYRSSQYRQLDSELRGSAPVVDRYLDSLSSSGGVESGSAALGDGGSLFPGLGSGPPDQADPGGGLAAPVVLPPGTFAEMRSANGTVLSHYIFDRNEGRPNLPAELPAPTPRGRIFTVPAVSGSTQFRVLEVAAADRGTTLIAVPSTEVQNALDKLVLIESLAVASLLVVLSGGAWFVLRRGLRPLERMARTAGSISSGDLSLRVTPADGKGEVGQLGLALNTMLTDIESAFAEREATEQKLRQFLADASHELRTPLTSIQGFAELFRVSGEHAKVDLPTILRRIEEESARMRVLVEDLLLLARLDQERDLERKPVDLAVLAADSCTDAVATDPARHITLDAPSPVVVAADETHLRQALANLISNALRHTPPGTAVEVCCRTEDGRGVVSVRDHGGGLDEESLRHVFDRFWQGDKARVGHGAGLGLSIVAAIAAEHGGSATAANAEGGGAVFTVAVPVS